MKKTTLKKNVIWSIFSTLAIVITGCTSNRIQTYIARGNDVQAIELLTSELIKNPSDKEYTDLFNQVYPQALEQRIPSSSVEETINSNLSYYGATRYDALSEIKRTLSSSSKISNHKAITSAISQAQLQLTKIKEAGRIQYCVSRMPSTIGTFQDGNSTEVYKSNEDFSGMYEDGVKAVTMFYYDIAEIIYADGNVIYMEESYNFYKKANSNSSYVDCRENLAQTAYEIGSYYQKQGGSTNLKKATSWYETCQSWNPNYKDVQNKSKEISYGLGMDILSSARSTNDYENAISYLNKAGDYKDAQTQSKEAMYRLAGMYRSTNSLSDYEKAGEYYTKLGNYKDSKKEAELYAFYKRMKKLSKGNSNGSISLSSGKWYNEYVSALTNSTGMYTELSITSKSSNFRIFSNIKDSVIYPGMIVKGDSIASQKFTELYINSRYPISYSINAGRVSITDGNISAYSASNINQDVKKRLNHYSANIQPDTNFEYTQVYSEEALEAALGFGYDRNAINYDKSIFYRDDTILLVKMTQKYYTTSVTEPRLPIDFFIPGESYPSERDMGSVTPYYVSSVDYGRQAIFIITSELPAEELKKDIEILRPTNINKYSNTLYQTPQIIYKWARNHTIISAVSPGYGNNYLNTLEGMYNWIYYGLFTQASLDTLLPVAFTMKNLCTNEYATLTRSEKYRVRNPFYYSNQGNYGNQNNGGYSNNYNNNGGYQNNGNGIPNNGGNQNSGNGIPNNGGYSNNGNGIPNNGGNQNSGNGIPNNGGYSNNGNGIPNNSGYSNNGNGIPNNGGNQNSGNGIPNNGGNQNSGNGIPNNGGNQNNGNGIPNNGNGSQNNSGNQPGYSNQYISVVFHGSNGKVYTCYKRDDTTYYYEIDSVDMAYTTCTWDSSKIRQLYINGIQMVAGKTIFDFSNVQGNTISFDYIDADGNRIHKLLVVYRNR